MLLIISLQICIVVILFIKRIQSYWSRQEVAEIKPTFFTGNVLEVVTYKKSWGQLLHEIYNQFQSRGVKFGGIYTFLKPTFVPLDPEIIKNILIKDFEFFADRGLYVNEEFEPLSGNLFTLGGKRWKLLRSLLIRAFTPYQVRKLFNSLDIYTTVLNEILLKHSIENRPVNIQALVASYTTDVTVGCLLGISSNSLNNPDCIFNKYGKKTTVLTWQKSATLLLAQILPKKICGLVGLKFTEMEIQNFFLELSKTAMECRKNGNYISGNFINMMLGQNNKGHGSNQSFPNYQLGLNDIAGQSYIAFIAGYETTATVLKLSLYELAVNQEIQNIVRENIATVLQKHAGQLTSEALTEMEYLDAIIFETLRKYPVCPVIMRNCIKRYQVPGTNVILDKGTLVNIPVLGLHMDPNYHPNPEKFDPSRFSKENKKRIKEHTFMPFGAGPKGCIGYRFAMLVIKMGLIEFIKNYQICLNEITKTPVEISPNSFFVTIKDTIWINLNEVVNESLKSAQ